MYIVPAGGLDSRQTSTQLASMDVYCSVYRNRFLIHPPEHPSIRQNEAIDVAYDRELTNGARGITNSIRESYWRILRQVTWHGHVGDRGGEYGVRVV